MQTTHHRMFEPGRDDTEIRSALSEGRRLVACLCAAWCSSCAAWRGAFESLSREFPHDCFVWIDIEDHSDLVADIEVETLPVLLVQSGGGIGFIGPIEPRPPVVRSLLARAAAIDPRLPDPGVRDLLLA